MHRIAAGLLLIALVGCTSTTDDPEPSAEPAPTETTSATPSPTPTRTTPPVPTSAEPRIARIGDEQWKRIVATGTWRPGCPAGRDDLRVLGVNYVTFDGGVKRGRIVANRDVVEDLGELFTELFEQKFPIARMQPVEAFDGDTLASLTANNTSAFNCRRPDQINAPQDKSPHANGRAIDINPDINPWMDIRCKCWSPRAKFQARTPGPGKILKDGPVVKAFVAKGWIWQNIDVADYMHFDTGYPSVPWKGGRG